MLALRRLLLDARNPADGNWNNYQQANDLYQPPTVESTGYSEIVNPAPANSFQSMPEPTDGILSPPKQVSYDELRARNRGFTR